MFPALPRSVSRSPLSGARHSSLVTRHSVRRSEPPAFTLLELLVVIAIIALALAFLIPSLGPASGRALDGATRQFTADLEGARLIAIAERTRTRVLIAVTNDANFGQDLALRAYLVTSFNTTANTWTQRGKWNRLSQSVAFDPNPLVFPDGVNHGIISIRQAAITPVAKVANGTATSFTGAYVEFRPTGSTTLDPAAPSEAIAVRDAIVDSTGTFRAKNQNLRFQITIDPLSGSVAIQ